MAKNQHYVCVTKLDRMIFVLNLFCYTSLFEFESGCECVRVACVCVCVCGVSVSVYIQSMVKTNTEDNSDMIDKYKWILNTFNEWKMTRLTNNIAAFSSCRLNKWYVFAQLAQQWYCAQKLNENARCFVIHTISILHLPVYAAALLYNNGIALAACLSLRFSIAFMPFNMLYCEYCRDPLLLITK